MKLNEEKIYTVLSVLIMVTLALCGMSALVAISWRLLRWAFAI